MTMKIRRQNGTSMDGTMAEIVNCTLVHPDSCKYCMYRSCHFERYQLRLLVYTSKAGQHIGFFHFNRRPPAGRGQ